MKKSILKSTILVMCLTIVAKLFGFFKSVIQASVYGSNKLTDAFNIANGVVSDIIYMITTAIAFAFVPIYISKKKNDGINSTKRSTAVVVTSLGLMALVMSFFLMLSAPVIMRIIAPAYRGNQLKITILFFRIMVIGIVFSLETSIYQNILNAEKKFGFSAFTSIINSVTLILFIVIGYKSFGIYALVFAIPCSLILQFICLYFMGRGYGKITLKYGIKDKTVRILMLQALPVLISNATLQINQAVDRALLISVEIGAVTAVSYGAILYQFVSSIIGMPISSVIYTELSEQSADKNFDAIKQCLNSVIKVLSIICIPIMIFIFFFSKDIVEIVYGHGNYTKRAIMQSAEGLALYGLCLLPVVIKQVLTETFYSLHDMKYPMIIGIFEVITNITLSVVLTPVFGIAGVVGATAIACIIFMIIVYFAFSKKYIKIFEKHDVREFFCELGSLVICILVCIFLKKIDIGYTILNFIIRVVSVFVIDILYLYVTKNSILMDICKMLKRKMKTRYKSQ